MTTSTLSSSRRGRDTEFDSLSRHSGIFEFFRELPIERLFALTLTVTLFVRLVVLLFVANAPLTSDARDYREMAELLVSGQRFVPYWPPGLPLYLSPFVASGASTLVLRAAMLPVWVLFCWGTYRAARALGIPRIALAVLTVFSLSPAAIHLSLEPLTPLPAAALLLVATSAVLRCVRGEDGWGESALLGVSVALLALTRPSALPLVVVVPALVCLKTRRFAKPLLSMGLAGLLIVGWMAKAHQLSGEWILNTSNEYNLYEGNNPSTPLYRTWFFGSHAKPGTEEIHAYPLYEQARETIDRLPQLEQPAAYRHLVLESVRARPALFLLRTFNRMRCFWAFDTFTAANLRRGGPEGRRWFPVVFGLDGAIYCLIAGLSIFWIAGASAGYWRRPEVQVLAAALLVYALPYWISMSHPTYHFPVVMLLALLGADAWKRSRGEPYRKRRAWAALLVFAAIQGEWLWVVARLS